MSYQSLHRAGLIESCSIRQVEIRDQMDIARRDVKTASGLMNLDLDWALIVAYNAALQLATAALAAAGYRPSRESHHYRVIQSLALTTGADSNLIETFDQFRKKRNIGGYERAGLVTDQEAHEMFELAEQLRTDVEKWIRDNYPGYG